MSATQRMFDRTALKLRLNRFGAGAASDQPRRHLWGGLTPTSLSRRISRACLSQPAPGGGAAGVDPRRPIYVRRESWWMRRICSSIRRRRSSGPTAVACAGTHGSSAARCSPCAAAQLLQLRLRQRVRMLGTGASVAVGLQPVVQRRAGHIERADNDGPRYGTMCGPNSTASRGNSGGYFEGRPIRASFLWHLPRIRCPLKLVKVMGDLGGAGDEARGRVVGMASRKPERALLPHSSSTFSASPSSS